MSGQYPQKYFWIKYFLAVILLILLLVLYFTTTIHAGPVLLGLLILRTISGPVQMYWLTKKGKFNDDQYLKIRNKQNSLIAIGTIIGVILVYIIILYHVFFLSTLSLPILYILIVFIAVDVSYDFVTFIHLQKKR